MLQKQSYCDIRFIQDTWAGSIIWDLSNEAGQPSHMNTSKFLQRKWEWCGITGPAWSTIWRGPRIASPLIYTGHSIIICHHFSLIKRDWCGRIFCSYSLSDISTYLLQMCLVLTYNHLLIIFLRLLLLTGAESLATGMVQVNHSTPAWYCFHNTLPEFIYFLLHYWNF